MTASSLYVQAGTSTQAALINKNGGNEEILSIQTGGVNAIVINEILVATFSSSGAVTVPRGTFAQRPAVPVNGMVRYNTDTARFEGYSNGWVAFT
jgi:hypothetical protein